ncbi:MAG TPA: STAS domain-containing protein [Planctomycetota bacterium]|nr:STAS domain-containing protein [Planctomycetota bacterium]
MVDKANLEVKGNTLEVHKDLYWEDHDSFSKRCHDLIAGEGQEVVIDLTDCGFVFSTYLGIIGNLFVEAKERNKKLKLRVSRRIEWIFQLAGFREMLEIEVVD